MQHYKQYHKKVLLSSLHLSNEWSHFRISSTDSNIRTTSCSIINNTTGKYSMWSLVRASLRCPWSASFPKMIKYFVKKKNTLNIERYRDLLIKILSYDDVSAFLLRLKTRNLSFMTGRLICLS